MSVWLSHRATTGVSPSVMGVRTGKSALLQMKASARVELPPLSTLSSQPLSCCCCCCCEAPGSPATAAASSTLSSAAQRGEHGIEVRDESITATGWQHGRGPWRASRTVAQHTLPSRSLDSKPIFCSGPFTSTWLSIAT